MQDLTDAFESGARDPWQRPLEVVRALALRGDETAVDLGAGTGYFARWLAPCVGRLIAVEPEDGQLARLIRAGFEVRRSLADVEAPVDLVFAAGVLRFLDADARARLSVLTRRLVLIDWASGARPVGPPASETIQREDAVRAFPRFRLGPPHEFLRYQWMVELERVD